MTKTTSTVCMKFQEEAEEPIFHSFEDFLEVGSPLDGDSENELEPTSDFAWFNGQPLAIESTEVFARFKNGSGELEHVPLYELHMSGTPIDTDTDKEMDLDSETVFIKNVDGYQPLE